MRLLVKQMNLVVDTWNRSVYSIDILSITRLKKEKIIDMNNIKTLRSDEVGRKTNGTCHQDKFKQVILI